MMAFPRGVWSERARSGAPGGNAEVSQELSRVAGAPQSRATLYKPRFSGRRSTFARSSTDFVAGSAASQGQVQSLGRLSTSQQVQSLDKGNIFRKVKYRLRGSLVKCRFVAGAAFSQGQTQVSGQGQHFRKCRYRWRCRQIEKQIDRCCACH